MNKILGFAGYSLLVIGSVMGLLMGSLIVILFSLLAGLLLVSVAKLESISQALYLTQSGLPLTETQMGRIIQRSPQFHVESQSFDVYPKTESARYHLIYLHQEYYIRVRVFYEYLRQEEDEYRFLLPGREPIILILSDRYLAGVELFEHQQQVFVKLSSLGLKCRIKNEHLILE